MEVHSPAPRDFTNLFIGSKVRESFSFSPLLCYYFNFACLLVFFLVPFGEVDGTQTAQTTPMFGEVGSDRSEYRSLAPFGFAF